MTWRWHVLGGLIAYGLGILFESVIGTVTFIETIPFLALAIFGALFPDIDTTSKVRKIIYGKWLIFFFAILIFFNTNPAIIISAALISLLPLVVHHRGIFHNIFFLALIPMTISLPLAWHFPNQSTLIFRYAYFFFLGALSHIALDKL